MKGKNLTVSAKSISDKAITILKLPNSLYAVQLKSILKQGKLKLKKEFLLMKLQKNSGRELRSIFLIKGGNIMKIIKYLIRQALSNTLSRIYCGFIAGLLRLRERR